MTARASGARRFRETQASDDDDDGGDGDGDDDDLFDEASEARPQGRPSVAEMVPQCEQARQATLTLARLTHSGSTYLV